MLRCRRWDCGIYFYAVIFRGFGSVVGGLFGVELLRKASIPAQFTACVYI
jgi:hypothetical protein